MTDEMEEFEKLLKTNVAPANDEAKKAAIISGMAAFDQQFSKKPQGITPESRLMDALRNFHITLFGGHSMKPRQIIAGSMIVAIGVLMLSSSSLTPFLPPTAIEKGDGAINKQKPEHVAAAVQNSASGITPGELPAPPQPQAITGSYSSQSATTTSGSSALSVPMKKPAPMQPMMDALKNEESVLAFVGQADKKSVAKDRLESKELAQRGVVAEKAIAMPVSPVPPPPPGVLATPMASSVSSPAYRGGVIGGAAGFANNGIVTSAPVDMIQPTYQDEGRDKFDHAKINPMKVAKEEPVSTFSVDVDTSSYSFMRASVNNNVLPQKDSVRIEEYINYFPYEYQGPDSKEAPFKANVAVMPTPWNSKTKLIHIGIKGYQIDQKEKPHANLVFLIDTSGSMNQPNKLPLLKNSFKLLLDSLKEDDTVGIVTYAGSAGVALEPTAIKDKTKILSVLDNLGAGGSTAGAEGIRQAYQLAEKGFDKTGVNRVILATDGDFNVGITNQDELKSFIERERGTGIFLSVLGFGMGNYNDAMMQALAQNGNAAYIDNLSEARKALVEEASSTLFTIAKDVKIQVEFNPAKVAEYHLIGYETRILNREDFNNDKVDAGDIGSGHTVTALYEITPVGSEARLVDDLRYGQKKEEGEKEKATPTSDTPASGEYAFVKIRYKLPDSDTSKLITTPVDEKVESKDLSSAPQEARFAASVAAYAQLLRGDAYTQTFTYGDVIALAQGAKGSDNFGYRSEFISLVRLAQHAATLPAQQQGGGYYNIQPQPVPMINR